MADRAMLCRVCSRWVTGMSESTKTLPWHRHRQVTGAACGGVGQKPLLTRGYANPPPTG